ncbi:MAG: hypothetical protein WC044_14860 [Crocinitomicaceae bacterium]
MKLQISLLFFCLNFVAFGQDSRTDNRLKLGTEISTTFSGLGQNGLTPFVTLKKNKVAFAIGPRFVYSSFDDYEIRNKNNEVLTVDANFRIYASANPHNIQPYIQFSTEYQYGLLRTESFYNAEIIPVGSPTFDHSFQMETEATRHNLNLYTHLGFEVLLAKHVYFNNSFGLGLQTIQNTTRYTNLDNGQIELRTATDLSSTHKLGWIVNLGLGFRF